MSNIQSIRWYILLETRLIDDIFDWKRGCLGKSELNNGDHGYSKTKKLNFWLKLNGRNARIRKPFCSMDLILFDEYLQDKTSVYILKACREIGQRFEKSLRGGKHVKNLEILWMNNKTIIEFGCRTMWRIRQISVDNILLDLHNSSHPTQPHSIVVK